jgi:hypothetical protein
MTTVEDVEESGEGPAGEARSASVGRDPSSIDEGRPWYAAEGLLALEVAGLAAFAFSRSVLDTFGRSPDTFVARGADAATIVMFGLAVALGPAVALAVVGVLSRPFGPVARGRLHLGLVAVVGGMAVWQIGQGITGYPPESQKLMVAGVVGGVLLAALRRAQPSTRTFLRFVGVASVVFLVQFTFLSPTSSLVFGDGPEIDPEVAADVAAELGDDPPDVVFVMFDALPTMSLLDGSGQVDANAFPHFARLAETSDWYRNHTSVAAFTLQSVPTVLTGRLRPDADTYRPTSDGNNLFTLLGGSYEMHVREVVTRLCPEDLCPRPRSPGLAPLLGDAVTMWTGGVAEQEEFDLPGAIGRDRFEHATQWIERQDLSGSRPQLRFYHTVLPHSEWYLTDTGEAYDAVHELPTGSTGLWWTETGMTVGKQRHLLQLQAADRLLGELFAKLDAADTFDESLVVVTADHGDSFELEELMRGLTEGNAEHIMWTPFFVKSPGQTEQRIDDGNVMAVDVLPTIADELGIELPWNVDGMPASQAATGRDDTKLFMDHEHNDLRLDDDEFIVEVEGTSAMFANVLAADQVEGSGRDPVWKRTPHGELFGRDIDDLVVGESTDTVLVVERLGDIEGSGTDTPMIEVVGDADLPQDEVVAYALNGVVGAVTTVEAPLPDGDGLVHGLLPPRLFEDGGNELTAYVVEGDVGEEVLRSIDVRDSQ